jgi:hypothetical protein
MNHQKPDGESHPVLLTIALMGRRCRFGWQTRWPEPGSQNLDDCSVVMRPGRPIAAIIAPLAPPHPFLEKRDQPRRLRIVNRHESRFKPSKASDESAI